MKRLRIAFSWLHIFHKRLFLRPSFLVLLLLIPISGAVLGLVAGMDSGVLKVHLATEEENEKAASSEETAAIERMYCNMLFQTPRRQRKLLKAERQMPLGYSKRILTS